MTITSTTPIAYRVTNATSRFLSGGRFPAFCLFALVFYQAFIAVMAFAPEATGLWGDFLEDFRTRCFRFDPKSGWLEMSSVWVMVSEPVALEVIFVLFWWKPLKELWNSRRRDFAKMSGAALTLVAAIAISLLGLGRARPAQAPTAFPADRLRTALPMPAFALRNQDDQEVTPATLKGRVVLVTAIYSSCTTACPMMLSNIRRTLDALTPEERANLSIIAFSLNPEADTRELREMIVKTYGLTADFHFVSGKAREVNALLDDLGVSRTRDENTGQIVHSNLFMLLDRRGRIAYRLSSSATEQAWFVSAIRTLIAEKAS